MNLPHDKFCVLPWVSLEASPIGTVRPCCLADDEIVDDAGNKFELSTATFKEVQHSNHMQSLREQFLAGEKPQTCRKCWNEERSGRTSKRMHTLDRLKHMLAEQEWTADAKPLIFLDLKLGNICNLKCRICGSWSSSQFASEEINQFYTNEEKKASYPYRMLRAGAWPRENLKFWSEIETVLDQIQYIEFTGGEPFMIQEHFDMLRGLVARGVAGNVEIHYNTNGTHYPENAPEIWQHFKSVEIAFSIDDVGQRFEYQRSNAVWAEVVENIEKFKQLKAQHSNIKLQCCTTVNVFNVRYIEHVANWVAKQGFDFVYWNMMHDAWYFSIATLPEPAKIAIAEHLTNVSIPSKYRQEFNNIIDFMNRGVPTDGNVLRMRIHDLDRKREQDLSVTEPEFAKLINYTYSST